MSQKKPPVALKKLAGFVNNINKQIGCRIEAVICDIYLPLNGQCGKMVIYFHGQSTVTHLIKSQNNSIQFDMGYVNEITSMSVFQLNQYASILNMYQNEFKQVIKAANVEEMPSHEGIFNMPFQVRLNR